MAMYQSALTGPQMDAALLALNRHDAEAWSVGTRGGEAVQSGDPTYMNNARYYAEQAAEHRGGIGIGQNLLDNWYFGNPINQRRATEYSTAATSQKYTIDRWKITNNNSTSNSSITLNDGFLTLSAVESTTQAMLFQNIEESLQNYLIGKSVTASVLTKDFGLISATIDFALDSTFFTTTIDGHTFRLFITSFGAVSMYITGGSIDIVAVKLELGSTQTLAHQENGVWVLNEIPNYTTEMLKCQRYLMHLAIGNYSTVKAFGVAFSTTSVRVFVPNQVNFRLKPSIMFSSGSARSCFLYGNGGYLTATSASVARDVDGGVMLDFAVSNAVGGMVYALVTASDSDILLSAEL